MTNTLRSQINSLAATFASAVFDAIRGASLADILEDGGRSEVRNGRGDRVSPGRGASAATVRRVAAGGDQPDPQLAPATAKKAAKGGRLARRSPEEIERALELVVALLRSTKDGLRSEQIRAHIGMQKEALPRVLKEGLATKQLRSKGEKRSTTYTAA
jgi:hypothetical protein